MNLFAHSIAEGCVDPLMAPDARQTFELARDDGGEEVPTVALDLEHGTVEAGSDEGADVSRGGLSHALIIG